jgi:GntR family transcriptional regulator / MocR family aminotransferase
LKSQTRHTPVQSSILGPILLHLDAASATPLYRQLYDGLRGAILCGKLPAGTRLPATRALAEELGVSRNTVANAFDQLHAEGYLEGRVGSGTYVSRALPDELLAVGSVAAASPAAQRRGLSQRGTSLAATRVSHARDATLVRPFRPGLPDFATFPAEDWARLLARHWQQASPALLSYGDPAGFRPLRETLAAYIGAARGVRCTAEQLIVVAGSQQALDLTARVLLDTGDPVWIEDPGYVGARGALQSAGARLVPVPVDAEGLDVAAGVGCCPQARLAYVTPSHQYPLGVTMSLPRRLALLEWARRAGAWVVEDDYDSEYRYASRPLPSLQGLDDDGCTIYIGTLSKVLAPTLRLGYLVVPPGLADTFANARALADRHGQTVEQAALAEFIADGQLARHIRRMRVAYQERRDALLGAAQQQLAGLLEVEPADAGMHLIGWLPEGSDDVAVARIAARYGVDAPPLSAFALEPCRPGLLLGYAAYPPEAILKGVATLAQALREAG